MIMKKHSDMEYAPGRLLDLYLPEGDVKAVFIYFHGGGLEAGDKGEVGVQRSLEKQSHQQGG